MILLSGPLIYITLCILLQFIVEVKSQKTIINPDLRYAHTTTFINDKLYILGGAIPPDIKSPKETFLYLDFSVPFNTNELKWHDLSNYNVVPPHIYAASIRGGANNNTLFLFGGKSLDGYTMALVYTFDPQSNSWRIPAEATGLPQTGKIGVTPAIDYNGLMYKFGGSISYGASHIYTNDMLILDSINLSWKKASSFNAPSPRLQYGAVFLPNKNIIYMGGYNVDTVGALSLNEVYLYDTTNDIWTTKTTNGLIPSARSVFSSVLGLDGQRIIIFGGSSYPNPAIKPETSLYVLDLNNFNWYIPKVSGKIPSKRAHHQTVLIGKYMAITFGTGYTRGTENDILLLDISNNDEYIWTTSFTPLSTTNPPNTQPSAKTNTSPSSLPQSNITGVNVGAVIGSLIGGILLTIGSFLSYKWYKNSKEQNNAIPTSGDERNNYPQETSREETTHYQSQQTPSQIQQVTIPIPEDAKPSVQQNIDQDTLQNLISQAVKEVVNNLRLSSQYNNNDDNVDNKNFNQGSE